MKTTFKIMISLVLAMLSVESAWAAVPTVRLYCSTVGGSVDIRNPHINNAPVATDGSGRVNCNSEVRIQVIPDFAHTLNGFTADNIQVVLSSNADQAQARAVTRGVDGPGVGGASLAVSKADNTDDVWVFTVPEYSQIQGYNISVTVTIPDKLYQTNVPYIDADGQEKTTPDGVKVYTIDGTETTLGRSGNDTNNQPYTTWYACPNSTYYSNQINIAGNVNIILVDDKYFSITNSSGYAILGTTKDNNDVFTDVLNIYGNSTEAGNFVIKYSQKGIHVGSVNFCSGSFFGFTDEKYSFICDGNMSIHSGDFHGNIDAKGDLNLLGGTICSYDVANAFKCGNGKTITLDFKENSTNFIICYDFNGTVKAAAGKRFLAKASSGGTLVVNSIVSGTVSDNSTINGKYLIPLKNYLLKITSGKHVSLYGWDEPDFTLDGYDYYNLTKNRNYRLEYSGNQFVHLDVGTNGPILNAVDGQPKQRSFTMPAQDVTIGVVEDDLLTGGDFITYDGTAHLPDICFGATDLVANDDYSYVLYGNQIDNNEAIEAGNYYFDIIGIGNYIGEFDYTPLTIGPLSVTPTAAVTSEYTFTGAALSPTVLVKDGTTDIDADSYTVTWQKKNANGGYDDVGSVLHSGVYRSKVSNRNGGNYTINAVTYSNDFSVSPATVPSVSYIDVEGDQVVTKTADNVTVLEGNETTLKSGNYVALQSYNNTALDLSNYVRIEIDGDVNIILNDGVTMQCVNPNGYCIVAHNDDGNTNYTDGLKIYGQSEQNGKLRLNGFQGGIYVGSVDIYGGQVICNDGNNGAINTDGDMTLHNGLFTGSINSIGNVNLLGGMCAAYDANQFVHCGSGKTITLGWLDSRYDYICVNRFEGPVRTADGKRLMANDYVNHSYVPVSLVSGTVNDLSTINSKTLMPYVGNVVAIPTGAPLSVINDGVTATVVGENRCYTIPADETVIVEYTGIGFIKATGLPSSCSFAAVSGKPKLRTFTMPAEDVTLAVSTLAVTLIGTAPTYNGDAHWPEFSDGTNGLVADQDYTVTVTQGSAAIAEPFNAGTYQATLTGLGDYIGTSDPIGFTILRKTVTPDISIGSLTYTGKPLTPTVTVKDGSTEIPAKNYTVQYKSGSSDISSVKTPGVYRVVLTAAQDGNYIFDPENPYMDFEVNKGLRTFYYETKEVEKTYGDENFTNNTLNTTDGVFYHTSNTKVATIDTETGEVKVRGAGQATITAVLEETEFYYAVSASYTLTVSARDVESGPGVVITQDQNGYSVTLTEDDDNPNAAPLNISGTVADLDFNRKLKAPQEGQGKVTIGEEEANLYTLCVPFALDTKQLTGAKFYTFSGVEGNVLQFTEVAKPAAYTPLVVAVFAGDPDITVKRDDVKFKTDHAINSTTVDGFTFTGTLTGLENAAVVAAAGEDNVAYILQNNSDWGKVVLGNTNVYIPPFRAYVTGPDITPNEARTLDSAFEGSATAISSLRLIDADGTERWYDLNGRRIYKPTQKGVYIHNGKKVIVK